MTDPYKKDPLKGSSAPDMFQKIEDESTWLGRLARKLPGFGGYMERSRRREADQILRDTIANRLEQTRLTISNVHQDLSSDISLAIEHAEPLGRADSRLMGLIGKIKDAPQGYSGFFDAVKIDEEDLAHLYEFDANMLDYSEVISANVTALQAAVSENGDVSQRIRELDASIQEANNAFNARQDILSGAA
ncbi:MAG: hypothetical protein ACOC9Z_06720 [Chloroflexota bacterium]